MERHASCKKFNFEEGINQQLLMKSNGKQEKWVEEFYLKYSTATSCAKRKLQKIRERNTKRTKVTKSSRKRLRDPK